jgi:hypothetical protein
LTRTFLDDRLQRGRGLSERAVGLDRADLWTPPVVTRDIGLYLGR